MDSARSASSLYPIPSIPLASGDSLSIITTRRGKYAVFHASTAIDVASEHGPTLTCSAGYSPMLIARPHVRTSVTSVWYLGTDGESEGLDASLYPDEWNLHREHDMADETILRVKGTASVPPLASAISHAVYDGKTVTLRAIGASAISQAVKAVAVARGYVAPRGIDLMMVPGFTTVDMPDGKVTAITLRIVAS